VLRELRQPKVAVMLALGFSSGLPFLLTANTFGYWLRDEGTSLKAIGFISWVGFAYAFKVYWSPLVDRLDVPLLGRLGRRRGWMLLCQILVAIGLLGMSVVGVSAGLAAIGALRAAGRLRLRHAGHRHRRLAHRGRLRFGGGRADDVGGATRLPHRAAGHRRRHHRRRGTRRLADLVRGHGGADDGRHRRHLLRLRAGARRRGAAQPSRRCGAAGLIDALIGPFVDFFRKHKSTGLVILLMVALYRLPDFIMGPMYNPYYHDLGISKDTVALVRGSFGLVATFVGLAAAGLTAIRIGMLPTLIVGLVLEGIGTAAFALLALHVDSVTFAVVMSLDSFAQAFAGVALVTYMSSLTSLGYTATQYAMLSSTYACSASSSRASRAWRWTRSRRPTACWAPTPRPSSPPA
jgi:PAT family beta-lactamase induction signal transducer AmpG